ncbi:glutathione S-transferase [Nannocystis sp. ILAH1]|nr:glutathione S-transferase [Nannocystis sp. ILAH1]MCY0986429.1 glutathione S-transferase [Nannocystis sp. ILAH1]
MTPRPTSDGEAPRLGFGTQEKAMITIHHLGHSQSERVVWLCEELGVPYELRRYRRDAVTRLSPPELKALHPLGAAPLLEDRDLLLAESAAIVEYIIVKHGSGRLRLAPDHPDYAAYLYWFHFSNGNLQPALLRLMTVSRAGLPADHPAQASVQMRLDRVMQLVDARLREATWLAGGEFTAADIMSVFSLTTMRLFQPIDLRPYPGILAYLQRIGERPAYRRALAESDPDLAPLLD